MMMNYTPGTVLGISVFLVFLPVGGMYQRHGMGNNAGRVASHRVQGLTPGLSASHGPSLRSLP